MWSWFACVLCVVFTLRCAFAFAQKHAYLFLGLCIYAGQFAVLIVFYTPSTNQTAPAQVQHNLRPNALLPALGGYFAALAGFILARGAPRHSTHLDAENAEKHARNRDVHGRHGKATGEVIDNEIRHRPRHVLPGEEAVAWLLLLVALPRAITGPFAQLLPDLQERDVEVLVTIFLDTFSYFALYQAIKAVHELRWHRLALVSPMLCYWLLNITYAGYQLITHLADMPRTFRIAFAAVKLVAVFTFVPAVLASSDTFSKATWSKRCLVFLHLAAGE
jgi:hypothetical protein